MKGCNSSTIGWCHVALVKGVSKMTNQYSIKWPQEVGEEEQLHAHWVHV
jgi:hypothetical protein